MLHADEENPAHNAARQAKMIKRMNIGLFLIIEILSLVIAMNVSEYGHSVKDFIATETENHGFSILLTDFETKKHKKRRKTNHFHVSKMYLVCAITVFLLPVIQKRHCTTHAVVRAPDLMRGMRTAN